MTPYDMHTYIMMCRRSLQELLVFEQVDVLCLCMSGNVFCVCMSRYVVFDTMYIFISCGM